MSFNNTRLPFNYWVVSSLTTNNGMSGAHENISTTNYSYAQGLYDFPDREFRGFGQVTETRADSSKVIHHYYQDEAKKGKEYKTEIKDNSDAPYAKTENTWEVSSADGVYRTNLSKTDALTYDGVASNPKTIRSEYQYYDLYGNAGLHINHGDTSVAGDEVYTYNEYWPSCSDNPWTVDRIRHQYKTDSAGGSLLRESFFWYDSQSVCATLGNLTKEEHWLDTGANPVTLYEYDSYGNPERVIDPEGRVSSIEYDLTFNTFPEKSYNAKNQLTTTLFNPVNGELTLVTDPNGFTTQFIYDEFHRKIKEIKPYDSEALPTVSIQYNIDGTAPEHVITSKREASGQTGTLDAVQSIDGLGNLIQTKSEYENPANMIAVDVYYDEMSRVKDQSNPYLTDNIHAYSTPNTAVPSMGYDYDALNRPVLITNPDNTQVSRTIDHWTVTETDEKGRAKSYVFDAIQRLLQVTENNLGESYITNYLYNPIGELTQITDHPGNITTIQYDSLGRKTSMNDPDMGTWSYGYDGTGSLVSQEDARGVITDIQYDPLNRKILIDYPNDTDVTFTYDTDTIGTLAELADSTGIVTYQYDERLRKTEETRAFDGFSWSTQWGYDAMDRPVSQTYPDGEVVTFNYNNQGLLDSIPGILTSIDYNEHGQIIGKSFPNSLNTFFSYYPGNQRLHTISTPGIQDFTYTYDDVGNVMSIADNAVGRTETFTYDDLDRLLSAGDSGYSSTYQYDAVGNMLSETRDGMAKSYTYGNNAGPHAVTGMTIPYVVLESFVLENGSDYTATGQVTLDNIVSGNPTEYMASEDEAFAGASWQPYSPSPTFIVSSGFGRKTVYFKVRDANSESYVKVDSIDYLLDTDGDMIPDAYDDDDDNDGMLDIWENDNGLNSLDASDASGDADSDGLNNLEEFQIGTNPQSGDTDNDGWSDYEEINNYQTDPANSDTDSDGYIDPEDPYPNSQYHSGSSENYRVMSGTVNEGGDSRESESYKVADKLGDSVSRKTFIDTDDDGIPDKDDADDDNDGIPDEWEIDHGMNPLDYRDALEDFDTDGLTNFQEYQYGTDLNSQDTDSDGVDDYTEIFEYNSDPLDQDTDDDGLIDSVDPAPTSIYHYGLSENFSVRKGNFNEGGKERSGDTYSVTDRVGNEFGSNVTGTQLVPVISVMPIQVDFGTVTVGTPSAVTVTVTNTGDGNLNIGSLSITGSDSGVFDVHNDDCSGRTLSPSGQCLFDAVFSPLSAGVRSADLHIPSDDPAVPEMLISLNGTGTDYHITGSGYNYPEEGFDASLSLDVQTTELASSWVNYYYSKLRISLVSTNITGVSVSGSTMTISGECKVNGIAGYTFTLIIIDGNPDNIRIIIYNPDGSVYFDLGADDLSSGNFTVVIDTSTKYMLTSSVNPSAAGDIDPDCSSGCQYDSVIQSIFTANENSGYIFDHWAGCDSPVNNLCTMLMDADKNLTANFALCSQPVRIEGPPSVYYFSLQQAYNEAAGGDTIQLQAVNITDTLYMNKTLNLQGGFNCNFTTVIGTTTINGNVNINDGTVTIENISLE